VPKAGHFVPNNNYWASYNFFKDYIEHKSLQCHAADGNCEVTDFRCEIMNHCSGHGACQTNGTCLCDAGWKSADCSMQTVNLYTGYFNQVTQYGPKYHSFTKSGSDASRFDAYSTNPMDIYISRGANSDPTEFSHDMAFTNTVFAKLDSDNFEVLRDPNGYSVTAYIKSYDEANNNFLSSQILVNYSEQSPQGMDKMKETVDGIVDATYEISDRVYTFFDSLLQ